MSHPAGERLVCESCGAEIQFIKACPCPETKKNTHADICCGQPMMSLGVQPKSEPQESPKKRTA